MLGDLPKDITTIYLANPCFSREEILSAIGRDLGMENMPASIEAKLAALHRELLRRHGNGERVLLVIDEAHAMPAESLEEVRLLSNIETGSHKLVNILLFGQPELDELLSEPRLRQVRDRIIHRFTLTPFSRTDGLAYLNHRLHIAGWHGGPIFTRGAIRLLMKASGGRARRINLLADKSLLAAYAEQARKVTWRHVRNACKDFEPRRHKKHRPAWLARPASASAATHTTPQFSWLQVFVLSLTASILAAAAALIFTRTSPPWKTPEPGPLPQTNTSAISATATMTPAPPGVSKKTTPAASLTKAKP